MTENEIAAIIVDVAYRIHKQLGPGLLESVHEAIMAYEIRKRGLHVSQQQALPVIVAWKYRADVPQAAREEHVARLRSVRDVVPGIESFSVGFDTMHLARSYDTGLVAVFRDRAALDAYTVHPEHVKVAALGRGLSDHVVSVDFEG